MPTEEQSAALEEQIDQWREYLRRRQAIHTVDVAELEDHLREQVAGLMNAGLDTDEAFLVAVKRMGDLDSLSREFAREHSDRLWKQLLGGEADTPGRAPGGAIEAVGFAIGAAVSIQVARVLAGIPGEEPAWFARNLALFVLPFLAAYLARRRRLDIRGWLWTAVPFVVSALVVNLYPFPPGSGTEVLVAAHLPVVLWFALAFPYTAGEVRSPTARMDFVRFTGEWVIYYALIGLGGGVLIGLMVAILDPIGPDLAERVVEWVGPSGAAGAAVVAAWLVESKQQVVENMAPVLTVIFTPLFALMLTVAAITYALSGWAADFDRELLGIFDALLVVVLGLVLYSMSARDPARPPGLADRVQLVAVVSALVLDLMVLAAMVARVGDLGFTPNRTAALGLNLVLLVNLAGAAWLSVGFFRGRVTFHRLEGWQTSYLPILAAWAAFVVVVLPPLFDFT